MKKMKLFGLAAIAIMLICGLGFVGCSNGSTSGTTTPPTYTVTVDGGAGATGAGEYEAGASVTVVAGTAPTEDQGFKNWTATGITLTNPNSATVTFTMPANAVTLTAVWAQSYVVNVTGGSLSGSATKFAAGAEVTIIADSPPEGQVFNEWTTTTADVTFASKGSPTTTFTMPESAVTVTATYMELYEYTVFTADYWFGPAALGGDKNFLVEDDGLLAVGPKTGAAVWALMAKENNLTLNNATLKSTEFAIKNMQSGKFINVKNVDRVGPGNPANPTQVKVSTFENTDDFWWKVAGRNNDFSSGTADAFNIYKGSVEEGGLLSYLDNDYKPSGNNPNLIAVYLQYGGDASEWINWDQSSFFDVVIGGVKFNLKKAEWPITYELVVVDGVIQGGTETTTRYEAGESVTVVAKDKSGDDFVFTKWTAVGLTISGGTDATYSFVMPESNVTITANYDYTGANFLLTVVDGFIADADGNVTTSKTAYIDAGDSVTVIRRDPILAGDLSNRVYTIKDDFKKWASLDITIPTNTTTTTYTFEMPGTDVTITAEFDTEKLYYLARTGVQSRWLAYDYDIDLVTPGKQEWGDTRLIDDDGVLAVIKESDNSPEHTWLLMTKDVDVYTGSKVKPSDDPTAYKGRKFAMCNVATGNFISRKGVDAVYWHDAGTGTPLKCLPFEDTDEFWWYIAHDNFSGDHLVESTNIVGLDSAGNIVGIFNTLGGYAPEEGEDGSVTINQAKPNTGARGGYLVHFVRGNPSEDIGDDRTWATWDIGKPGSTATPIHGLFDGKVFDMWLHD
ncbi:MAG: hypothetical protein LBB72_03330 [Spirochaetaceae bacterium]|jgi:hypothetical protein|nr:hypothetical protein [Spirochaetaceae bacterium]